MILLRDTTPGAKVSFDFYCHGCLKKILLINKETIHKIKHNNVWVRDQPNNLETFGDPFPGTCSDESMLRTPLQ